jgi:hypothetical protein
MLPYALFRFDWPEAGGKMFEAVDQDNRVYKEGSTISETTVDKLGLKKIKGDEDAQELIHMSNAAYLGLQMLKKEAYNA